MKTLVKQIDAAVYRDANNNYILEIDGQTYGGTFVPLKKALPDFSRSYRAQQKPLGQNPL